MIKFDSLLANCVIFQTALDMIDSDPRLVAEGWQSDDGGATSPQLSPYITEHIAGSASTPPTSSNSGLPRSTPNSPASTSARWNWRRRAGDSRHRGVACQVRLPMSSPRVKSKR